MHVTIDAGFLTATAGQLLLAAVCAGAIGFERELRGHPAGLRTHILVGVGATLITLVSMHIATGHPYTDRSRIAAQIVSGIGFLGAGTIIRQGSAVKGLTTAASLWAVAGVGMAIAVGRQMLIVAIITTAIVYATLAVVREAEHWLEERRRYYDLRLTVTQPKGVLYQISQAFDDLGVEMLSVVLSEGAGSDARAFVMRILNKKDLQQTAVTKRLMEIPEAITVEWD